MSGWGSILGAVIPAAASLGSAYLGANAARDASRAQQQAADQATGLQQQQMALQQQIFDQNRADLAPWRATGQRALGALEAGTGATYQQSPSYAFRRAEGMRAIDAGMAARGLYNSSARDRAGARFADGLASQDYDQWWNRNAAMAGIGQTATGQGIQAAQQYGQSSGQVANNLASIYGQAGNAQAAGAIGQANAWGGAFNNLANQDWRGIFGK